MRIATVLVVGDHHVRAKLPHRPYQRLRRLVERDQGERSLGQRWERVALGQAGVDEAEPTLAHPEDAGCLGHLLAADLIHPIDDTGQIHRGVEHAATLAAGERDDEYLVPLVGVAGKGRGPLARLVVGVCMHSHEAQSTHVFVTSTPFSPQMVWTPTGRAATRRFWSL